MELYELSKALRKVVRLMTAFAELLSRKNNTHTHTTLTTMEATKQKKDADT